MTKEKAKEILTEVSCGHWHGDRQDFENALKLGIEALKWRLLMECMELPGHFPLLPGETLE